MEAENRAKQVLMIEDEHSYYFEPFPRQLHSGSQLSPEMLFRYNPSKYMKEVIVKQNSPKIDKSFTLVSEQIRLHEEHPEVVKKRF